MSDALDHGGDAEASGIGTRRRARDRLLAAGLLLPVGWVGATILYGWSAMLRLGRWPLANADDPAQVFGSGFHALAMLLFSASVGVGGLLFLLAAAAVGITPDRPLRDAARVAALTSAYLLAWLYIRSDPIGVLAWMGD